mmetsp:Transcript_15416/g.27885  ORF Transcript_15416/g.27885 Transcript_15416/m.27885 type:complete len:85 (+) Transcript_15416:744-998(+)
MPKVQMSSRSQVQMASTVLDGAMHGVTDVWHPDTLDAMAKLIQQPMLWCRRSGSHSCNERLLFSRTRRRPTQASSWFSSYRTHS